MKRGFLAVLAVLVVAGTLVAAIESDPGYVLVAYGGYSLETSIWVALALFLLGLALLWLMLRWLRGGQIGRASCRERVWMGGGGGRLRKDDGGRKVSSRQVASTL